MKIKKFQKPADKLDKPVEVSPEREAEIRASQQAALNDLWKQRREYAQQSENKTDSEKYLDFLDRHGILYADDYTRKLKLQQLGYSEGFDKDGNPVLTKNLEPPLQSEDFDFAMALAGGLGTKAAAKSFGWLPTIAEEIGAGTVGTAATYGSNYLGQAIDNKYGTNVTPWLTIGGGLTGSVLGGHWGNRGAMKTAKYAVDNGIRGYGDFHPEIQKEILKTPKPRIEPLLNNGKYLLDSKYGIKFDNEPFIPDIKTNNISSQTNPMEYRFDESDYKFPLYKGKFMNWFFLSRNKPVTDQITVDDLREFVKSLGNRDGNNFSISAADMNLRRNFEDFVDELTQENTYHKSLSANDILNEFNLMSEKETPINPINYPHINEYFTYDAFPRLIESFKRSKINLKPEDELYIKNMYAHPFNGIKAVIGYTPPGTGGFSRGTNLIRFSNRISPFWENVKDDTIVHELHHNLRKRLAEYLKSKGYDINPGTAWLPEALESGSWSRNNKVRGSYLPSELETMKPLAMLDEFNIDKTPAAEIGAVTAGNARFRAWSNLRRELGRIPTMEELDRRINNYDDYKLYKLTSTLPYGEQIGSKAYDEFVKKSAGSNPDDFDIMEENFVGNMANYWRNAMKYIGGATGAAVGLNGINAPKKEDKKIY